jgi:hypothetical protein
LMELRLNADQRVFDLLGASSKAPSSASILSDSFADRLVT